jgi:hypothetical protein
MVYATVPLRHPTALVPGRCRYKKRREIAFIRSSATAAALIA